VAKSVTLSKLIAQQVPGHVRKNYDTFVKFLEYYYEWLEQKYGPTDVIRNWETYGSVDSDVDEFVNEFKSETLYSLPLSIVGDKRRLLLHAREFLKTKGTERSFKFLFRILFNEDVDLYLPKENIFRLSDGDWVKNDNVIVATSINDPSTFLYKRIKQVRVINEFLTEEASALVIKAERYRRDKIVRNRFFVSDVRGVFKDTHPVFLESDEGTYEYLYPIVTSVDITTAGTGYIKGDTISLDGTAQWVVSGTLNIAKIFDTKVTSLLAASDIVVKVNTVTTTSFTFDGRYITLSSYAEGDDVEVLFPSVTGYVEVDGVDSTGGIVQTRIYDFPIGYPTSPTYSITSRTGSGAVLQVNVGTVGYVAGYYIGSKGMPSSTNFLQDSLYYQEYSYVIRASRSVDTYASIVKQLLHPAGMMMFGEISILSLISMIIRDMKSYVDVVVLYGSYVLVTSEALHSRVMTYDKHKTAVDLDVNTYENFTIQSVLNNYRTKWDYGLPVTVTIQ